MWALMWLNNIVSMINDVSDKEEDKDLIFLQS